MSQSELVLFFGVTPDLVQQQNPIAAAAATQSPTLYFGSHKNDVRLVLDQCIVPPQVHDGTDNVG